MRNEQIPQSTIDSYARTALAVVRARPGAPAEVLDLLVGCRPRHRYHERWDRHYLYLDVDPRKFGAIAPEHMEEITEYVAAVISTVTAGRTAFYSVTIRPWLLETDAGDDDDVLDGEIVETEAGPRLLST